LIGVLFLRGHFILYAGTQKENASLDSDLHEFKTKVAMKYLKELRFESALS
jgi:hypothetical protein